MNRVVKYFFVIVLFRLTAFGASISLSPVNASYPVGTPLAVNIEVADITDLYAFQFDIQFDPSVLSAISVDEGDLFASSGTAFSSGTIDNTAGTVSFIGDSLSGPGPGISSDGPLATVMFASLEASTTNVLLRNIILLDSNLNDIPASESDAVVTTTSSAVVPEPTTLPLMVGSLTVIACAFIGKRKVIR